MSNYLEFSSSQKRGAIVLLLLLTAIFTINMYLPELIRYPREDHSAILLAIKKYQDSVLIAATVSDTGKRTQYYRPVQGKEYRQGKKPGKAIVDLNLCDTSDLICLPGIGPVFASRIIKYREILGGYYSAEQLLEVYGMDSARYLGIAGRVKADEKEVRKINVNSVTFSELLRHPYFEYEDVKMIFGRRDETGVLVTFEGFDTLFPSGASRWQKAAPYLQTGDP